jgi:hypothetical protein
VSSLIGRTLSHYQIVDEISFLGEISARRGERAKAAEYYRRFLQYWDGGDLDRDRVAHARTALARST